MENVKSNRCKAEQNEHKSRNTFPYAILRSLSETESISTWKSSTHTHTESGIFLFSKHHTYLPEGIQKYKLWFEFLGQNTSRRLYQELDILCRQQHQCALWQSSLLAAPSSLQPRGGPSDQISSSSSCHFTCLLKQPCPRSDLGSFGLHWHISQLCHRILSTSFQLWHTWQSDGCKFTADTAAWILRQLRQKELVGESNSKDHRSHSKNHCCNGGTWYFKPCMGRARHPAGQCWEITMLRSHHAVIS